jgi:hypothetical protein
MSGMKTRTWVGAIALAALTILGVLIAAAGPDVVPAAGRGGDPSWLEGAYGDGFGIAGGDYILLERAALIAYAAVIACAAALPGRLLWAAMVGLIAAFTIAPPLLSLDVFSYISYARLDALAGLNPYEVARAALPSGDPAVPFVVDNRDVVSVYGPLFTILSLPLAQLGVGAAVYAVKAAVGLSVLATAWLVSRLAVLRGLDPRPAAALVALNPLVLVHVIGGGHNDALMALVLTMGLAGALTARELGGGIALAAAAAVKVSAAFVFPFALVEGLKRRRLLVGLLAGSIGLLALALALYGSAVDATLTVSRANQERGSSISVPSALADNLGLALADVRGIAIGLYAIAVAGLLVWTARGADWIRAAGWAGLGLLVASAYVTPWYVILALPLAAISRDRALVAASVVLTAFLLRQQLPGLGG